MADISVTSGATRSTADIIKSIDDQVKNLSGGDAAKTKEIFSKVSEILAGSNVRVTRGDASGTNEAGDKKTNGATNAPALDNPDDTKAKEADLAKLIAFLQLDNEERQAEMAKDRINLQKDSLKSEHEGRMKEIDDSIKKMKDAEKAAKASRFFGWLGAIVAVIAAVVLTVVTGGAAAAFAIAGAVLAVTSLVLNETGAMDKMIESLAEHLQEKYGKSGNDARLAATLIINIGLIALSAGCGIGSLAAGAGAVAKAAADTAAAAAKTMSMTAKVLTMAMTISNTAVSAGSIAAGGFSTYYSKVAEDKKADVMELEKFMATLQQQLDECQEELQILLEQIEGALGKISELVTSATDTSAEIAKNIGEMA